MERNLVPNKMKNNMSERYQPCVYVSVLTKDNVGVDSVFTIQTGSGYGTFLSTKLYSFHGIHIHCCACIFDHFLERIIVFVHRFYHVLQDFLFLTFPTYAYTLHIQCP